MNKENKDSGITLAMLRSILPFILILISIIFAWTSLTSQINLLNERGMTINEKLEDANHNIDALEEKQDETTREIIRLATAFEASGISFTGNAIASAVTSTPAPPTSTPTPTSTPENREVIVNFTQNQPEQKPIPTPMPQPEDDPQPTSTPTNVIQDIINDILGVL